MNGCDVGVKSLSPVPNASRRACDSTDVLLSMSAFSAVLPVENMWSGTNNKSVWILATSTQRRKKDN